jgi:hypothetical protein
LLGTELVTTLTLGLRPSQRFAKVWAKVKPMTHISCSQEWTHTLPNGLPPWELES